MNTMASHRIHASRRESGISLMEMMVGITVGVVCVLVIVQLLSAWESRKRTTSAGADAQITGTLASFTLDRDLRLAGYGFGMAEEKMGCAVAAFNATLPTPVIDFRLRPVEITKGATAADPDTIRVLYGDSAYFVTRQNVTGGTLDTKKLKSRDGFQLGDKVILADGASPVRCQLIEVTAQTPTDIFQIEHKSGESYQPLVGGPKTASMNPAGGTAANFNSGVAFNLGQAPVLSVWSVDPVRHTLSRYNAMANDPATQTVTVAGDVVTFKAQYGIDANDDNQIGTAEWTDTTTALTDWSKVLAVRFALLVRSRQYERTPD
ncbi:MAG: hypothetical protein EOO22_06775, partial [Comamonadaceae bacterium]